MAKSIVDILGAVPNSDTDRKQIEYLPLDKLIPNEKNFYTVSDVDSLASGIATVGLLDPICVYPEGDEYKVISGHRRRAALLLLAQENPDKWSEVPCIVDRSEMSPEARELKLIFANSDTRKMSSADISQQVDRVRELLYALQEQGYEFPGRMRDHVAEVCGVSKSKIARLDAIKSGLEPSLYADYYEGDHTLNESTAYELSKLPVKLQSQICSEYLSHSTNGLRWLYASDVEKIGNHIANLGKMICDVQERDCNREAKTRHIVKALIGSQWADPYCSKGCCEDCPTLQSCKDVCDLLKSKQAQMKSEAKAEKTRLAAEKEAKERPAKEQISGIYLRFSYLLDKAGISIKDYLAALSIPYAGLDDATVEKRCYSDGVQPTTDLPFNYSFSLETANRLCKAADILGCSIDYLLCRTDETGDAVQAFPWHGADEMPGEPCDVVVDFLLPCDGGGDLYRTLARWDGLGYVFKGGAQRIDMEPVRWMRVPEVENAPESLH